jgi:guanosine-3',5'-bis(diphosphate) 3'-pyrophosphohydrolase
VSDANATLPALEAKLLEYFPDANLAVIRKAHDFARDRHAGQKRSSGEPYIIHPIGVSTILAELRLDIDSVITGLLHDTVEDTGTTLEEIQREFGASVAALVDGVTKISRITFRTTEEKQAENFRKMVVAMAKDLRVILVKLADRTHNMRTLEHLSERKQREIAQETLDIYAPLANRLGIHWMKAELEDLCFCYLRPEAYGKLKAQVAKKRSDRERYIQDVIDTIEERLKEYGIQAEVTGRPKHFYSIFKKMEERNVEFEDIYDIVAFRIIINNITECYKALGVMHAAFRPVAGRFKDYIAMPKPNNYQSLHTTVIGPYGERLEIQIRTLEMHQIANSGVAAHWKYKEGRANSAEKSLDWLNRLMENHNTLKDPNEFLESVKMDLYQGEVYVFTPQGEVKEFPEGSTPIDFAYSVHTGLGHTCVGAKINGKMVPLRHKLKSGDTIEILTSPTQKPSKDWLKLVKSSRAISKIRAYVKQEERVKAREMGAEILERELRKYKVSLERVMKSGDVTKVLKEFNVRSIDDLYVSIGFGRLIPKEVVGKILTPEEIQSRHEVDDESFLEKVISTAAKKSEGRNAVMVGGMDDVLIRYAKCCAPIPGDSIVGFITRGRGVTVHVTSCPKALESGNDRQINVAWNVGGDKGKGSRRNVKIRVHCEDTPGLLAAMSAAISSCGVNISKATVRTSREKKAICVFELGVTDLDQLRKVTSALEAKPGIIRAERVKG